jgi:hypothetical protein
VCLKLSPTAHSGSTCILGSEYFLRAIAGTGVWTPELSAIIFDSDPCLFHVYVTPISQTFSECFSERAVGSPAIGARRQPSYQARLTREPKSGAISLTCKPATESAFADTIIAGLEGTRLPTVHRGQLRRRFLNWPLWLVYRKKLNNTAPPHRPAFIAPACVVRWLPSRSSR